MRTLKHWALLSAFVAAGVGLALGIGLSTHPVSRTAGSSSDPVRPAPERDDAPSAKRSGDPVRSGDDAESIPPETAAPADDVPTGTPATEPAIAIPPGPMVAEAHPRRTYQAHPEVPDSRMLQLLEYLKGQIAPESPPAPMPPAPPGERAVAAAESPQEVAASEPAGRPARPRNEITRSASGEGDGNLSIHFQNTDIREVLESLSEQGNLNILASNSVQGNVSATLNGVDVDSALDAILRSTGYVARREGKFIYVGNPKDFETLEQSLDTIGTRVYRPNYVTASELQALIQPLITSQTGVVSVSSPAETGIGADATNAGGDAFAGGEVVLVRDYEAVLSEVDQVVAEIDVRPLQVAIEAMILSVRLDDGNDFGVNFELLRNNPNIRLGWGTPLEALTSLKFDKGGLKFGFLDSNLGAFLNALESVGDTNVIATPRLMVLNKHRAEILIGEELGYVSTTMTETSSTQSVEFLEVGAQLRLRPFISSDGLIRMEIHPELSTGSVEVEENFTLPNKETTQVTTNIMVRDGCTLVIGGLMREEMQTTSKQVPLFGSLPLVGPAFQSKNETLQRREILVLITPRIVYEPEVCEEGDQGACEFHRRQAVYAEKMSPVGKRHIARRYFRLAQNAWAEGDQGTALRFAELSVHFDPLSRAAIELRSNIWQGSRQGGDALAGSLDGATIAPWLLDDLQREPAPVSKPLHPLDPGQPGRHTDIERPRSFQ